MSKFTVQLSKVSPIRTIISYQVSYYIHQIDFSGLIVCDST